MLVATVPQLQALNPLQLRRAVKDYRHEVNEPRMSEECSQYLQQLVRDWDRKRVKEGVEGIQREVSQRQVSRALSPESLGQAQASLVANLDSLFDVDIGLSEYHPTVPKPSTDDLENSRFNIPFAIPSQQYLGAVPTASKNMNILSGSSGQGRPDGRPSSPASYSSSRPMAYNIRTMKQLQQLPDDFVAWLKLNQRAAVIRLTQGESEHRSPRALLSAVDPNAKARLERTPERPTNVSKLLNRTSCGCSCIDYYTVQRRQANGYDGIQILPSRSLNPKTFTLIRNGRPVIPAPPSRRHLNATLTLMKLKAMWRPRLPPHDPHLHLLKALGCLAFR